MYSVYRRNGVVRAPNLVATLQTNFLQCSTSLRRNVTPDSSATTREDTHANQPTLPSLNPQTPLRPLAPDQLEQSAAYLRKPFAINTMQERRLREMGFNPSVIALPQHYTASLNATYVATSRYERNNINQCLNNRVVHPYNHFYSSTLVTLLDKNYVAVAHAYMEAGDSDRCESGRWRSCDARLIQHDTKVAITFVNFWGNQSCRGYWLATLSLKRSNGLFHATVYKRQRLKSPRNSGVLFNDNNVVEFDVNGVELNVYSRNHSSTLRIPNISHSHTSGHPTMLNATHIALWIHYHKHYGGSYRYGHGYIQRVLYLDSSYKLTYVSPPFCLFRPCRAIEFVMNTFRDVTTNELHAAVGVDDCFGVITKLNHTPLIAV